MAHQHVGNVSLHEVAAEIPPDQLTPVGVYLKISLRQIERFKQDNQGDCLKQMENLLIHWKKEKEKEAKKELTDVLQKCRCSNVIRKVQSKETFMNQSNLKPRGGPAHHIQSKVKKGQYKVSIAELQPGLQKGFYTEVRLRYIDSTMKCKNGDYTFLALFDDDDQIDARYFGNEYLATIHYNKLKEADSSMDPSGRCIRIRNFDVDTPEQIKGTKYANHEYRIKITPATTIEKIDAPEAEVENSEDMVDFEECNGKTESEEEDNDDDEDDADDDDDGYEDDEEEEELKRRKIMKETMMEMKKKKGQKPNKKKRKYDDGYEDDDDDGYEPEEQSDDGYEVEDELYPPKKKVTLDVAYLNSLKVNHKPTFVRV